MKLTAYQKDVYAGKICPYCKSKTKIITQKEVYGKTYNSKRLIIACTNWPQCDAIVGTDEDKIALGRLANKELRQKKEEAHLHFDKLWKEKYLNRSELYKHLSEFLDIPAKYTHIGMFNVKTCQKVIDWSVEIYKELENS